jgi:hypothetical protein
LPQAATGEPEVLERTKMGKLNGPYKEELPIGTIVRMRNHDALEAFQAEWKYHNPNQDEQLCFAGKEVVVEKVSFYHGGDAIYSLKGIPGVWHEACLEAAKRYFANKQATFDRGEPSFLDRHEIELQVGEILQEWEDPRVPHPGLRSDGL